MFSELSRATQRKLWPHQVDAINFAIDHLNKFSSACLIRMPTGTGKTGVIACLTKLSNAESSLILTPWAHLRKQMLADLESDFWTKVGVTPRPTKVVPLLPSTAKNVLGTREPQVIVATFSTLNDLRLNYRSLYDTLANTISLAIVDEGHYEPAVQWSKSVINRYTLPKRSKALSHFESEAVCPSLHS
jgi:superfamily II DNA or RNA helicase